MLTHLLRDPIVRIVTGAWVLVALLLFVPILPHAWMVFYSEELIDIPFLLLAIVATWRGLRTIEDDAERRFWVLWGGYFAASLAVSVPYAWLDPTGRWTFAWQLIGDVLYLAGYLCAVLAVEVQPHKRQSDSFGDRERQLRALGFIVLAFFVVVYFVLVPALLSSSRTTHAQPTYMLYVVMDMVLLYRLLANRRDAWSVRWTWVYTWFAVAMCFVLIGDAFELSTEVNGLTMPSATLLDLLWTTPLALMAVGVRARHVAMAAELKVLNETAVQRSPLRAGHMLLVGAMVLPVVHIALRATHQIDPGTSVARNIVSVACMAAMGALALLAYQLLDRDRSQMEAKELRLVNELGVARKMDAVARLAASVAHDFNNLIHIIQGRTDVLAEQLGPDDPMQEEVREIIAASQRAAGLARQLMAFGRTQPTSPATVSLHELLGRAEQLVKPLLDERTRLGIRAGASHDVVRIDPLQFERVMLNLITNARDAMPSGGSVTIETFNPGFEALGAQPYTDLSVVRLTVTDTGAGMERNTMAHIFEPFFTTKEGRGHGLGLAITHGLIQQAGGSITVESELGKGTRFSITLPVVRGAEPSPVGPIPGARVVPGAVLIVEMDAANRQLLRRLLADLGRPILTAAAGPEAVGVAAKYPGSIDLAVVDVTCEGGRTLAAQLRELERVHEMAAILLAQDQPIEPGPLDYLLREPFELVDVVRAARRLVARKVSN